MWTCKKCSTKNWDTATKCSKCGIELAEDEIERNKASAQKEVERIASARAARAEQPPPEPPSVKSVKKHLIGLGCSLLVTPFVLVGIRAIGLSKEWDAKTQSSYGFEKIRYESRTFGDAIGEAIHLYQERIQEDLGGSLFWFLVVSGAFYVAGLILSNRINH